MQAAAKKTHKWDEVRQAGVQVTASEGDVSG